MIKKIIISLLFLGLLFLGILLVVGLGFLWHSTEGKPDQPIAFSHNVHIDLADQMSFYDCMRRRFNLHMWCKAFGIESPKEGGVTGIEVRDLYAKGEYSRIARYCIFFMGLVCWRFANDNNLSYHCSGCWFTNRRITMREP